MERGVVVGGLMIFGSFLLAAVLNRSAMEEVPAAPPATPVTVVAPMSPPVSEAELAPGASDCAEPETKVDSDPAATGAEQGALDSCGVGD